jgi:integrase
MGRRNYLGVRTVLRRGKRRLLLDFRYLTHSGRRARFRRDATTQTRAAAVAEAARLMKRAAETGKVIDDEPIIEKPKLAIVSYAAFFAGDFEKHYMPSYSPATRLRYTELHRQRVGPFFGAMPLGTIEAKQYREFAATLQTDDVQTKGPLNLVRTVLRAAFEHGLIEVVPIMPKGLIKASKKLPSSPSADELRQMLTADGWLGIAIALAGFAGLRSGEVRALEVRDIDFERQCIMVRHAMSENTRSTTKSGHERTVNLVPALGEHLAIAVMGKASDERIVVLETGRTPTRQELLGRFKTFLRRAKLKERSFHSLRHFFISEMMRKGASAEAVRELAGHTSLVVTQRYAHATDADRRAAVNKLAN